MHATQHGVPATPGQVDIEQHHVGEALADELDGRLGLVRLTHHLDRVAELRLHTGAEHCMVLDQENTGPPCRLGGSICRRAHRTRARRGMDSCTSAPSPGADRTTAEPPKRTMRARMDCAIPCRSSGTASGSNPQPRSRT